MASRYYSFNVFMDDVIEAANDRVDLEDLFIVKNLNTYEAIRLIINRGGWQAFVLLVGFLLLGPIAFSGFLIGFGASPIGLIVLGIFGTLAIPTIKALYQDRELPIAIKEVGKEFISEWQSVEGQHDEIDILLNRASSSLIRKASERQRKLLGVYDI